MEEINYPRYNEVLYTTVLANGLRVNLLPRKNFHKTYGVLTTDYGSIDNTFIPYGKEELIKVPDGIAHFLEHKMFEKQDHDAFDLFGQYGASANAFTSFTRTSYLFSATRNVDKCIEILLDFVQEPYFSEKTIEKERGIIGQEIKMYDDDPSWQLYFGIIGNLYPEDPLASDIAGTVDSIAQITPDDLYACYRTFYQPSNMNLFLVGGFNQDKVLDLIQKNQANKTFDAPFEITRAAFSTDKEGKDVIPYRMNELNIQRPAAIVGIKGLDDVPGGRDGLFYKLSLEMLMYLLYDETSEQYLELYNKGILDDSFSYDVTVERGFHFVTMSGDTEFPQDFSNSIIGIAENAQKILENAEERFELAKRELIGRSISAMNSLENIANRYEGSLFDYATIFDIVPLLEKMTLKDVEKTAESFIRSEAVSVYQILPKGEEA